jgi:hypothetical protein
VDFTLSEASIVDHPCPCKHKAMPLAEAATEVSLVPRQERSTVPRSVHRCPALPHGGPRPRSRTYPLPEPVAWRGSWWAPNGTATGSRPARATGQPGQGQRPTRLVSRRVVPADAEVQVHPAALPLDLIDLALAVVLTTGLERQQLSVPRERLERGQHVSYSHPLSVARRTLYVVGSKS